VQLHQPVAAIAAQEDAEVRAAAELARGVRLDLLTALAGR
jgi:LPS-assembly lipoprotein